MIRTLLYGSEATQLFPNGTLGGMSVDPSIFIQSAVDINKVEASTKGLWRIFSKLGAG